MVGLREPARGLTDPMNRRHGVVCQVGARPRDVQDEPAAERWSVLWQPFFECLRGFANDLWVAAQRLSNRPQIVRQRDHLAAGGVVRLAERHGIAGGPNDQRRHVRAVRMVPGRFGTPIGQKNWAAVQCALDPEPGPQRRVVWSLHDCWANDRERDVAV